MLKRHRTAIVIAILALILANAAIYAFTHYEGVSSYGDDPAYLWLAGSVIHGGFKIDPGFIFSVRLAQFMPIALSYALFGVNTLSSSLWDIFSYLGIVLVTFLIVRMKYSDRAALLSSFLVSIFPLLTQYAVNAGDGPTLVFAGALAFYLMLLGERDNSRRAFFASGVMLVVAWLISYEAAIVIAFVFAYALLELIRGKLAVDRDSLFFLYGIAALLIIVFAYSAATIGMPFAIFTVNSRFYSAVGVTTATGPTIPSADTNLGFYPSVMFPYHLTDLLYTSSLHGFLTLLYQKFFLFPQYYSCGLYFYLLVPITAVLLALRDRRSYLFIAWFAFMFLLLEFGPMHVAVSFNPLGVTYLLAHRLDRFLLPAAPAIAAILGIGLDRILSIKNRWLFAAGVVFVALVLCVLYANNAHISSFYYWWIRYPQLLVMQPANFLRFTANVGPGVPIYIDAVFRGSGVLISYSGASFPTYIGRPTGSNLTMVPNDTDCSHFVPHSYVVWSGSAPCTSWVNVFNVTAPYAPSYFIRFETPTLVDVPTNVYYVR